MPYASQKILAITLSVEGCVFEHFGRLPSACNHSSDCVYWTPLCNNGSMLRQLSRIDAKIPFDYAKTTPKHAPNHQHAAASGRLLENAVPIAQAVFSYQNVHVKYGAHVFFISLPCQLSHFNFSIVQNNIMHFYDIFFSNCLIWMI